MNNYYQIKREEPIMNNCFFAFSEKQFNEGLTKFNLKKSNILQNKSINGLFGTKEGINEFLSFYSNKSKKIALECTPQQVYNYEFDNFECEYSGSDEQAIDIVVAYFGIEQAKTVNRKYGYSKL